MKPHVPSARAIDPDALEARTQAIGRELFAAATRTNAHLSVLNRWTSQVLSWCLADPAAKSAVLRFLDVLPSLRTPLEVARHVRDYFPTQDLRLPPALRLGAGVARPSMLTKRALAALVTQLVEHVAAQFIAQSHPEGVQRVVQQLAARGATCSLDVLGGQGLSEPEADQYAQRCRELLEQMASVYAALPPATRLPSCGPRAN